jgi:aspartoacylase
MVYYAGAKIIRKVGLVGGTHGNELLGIELVKGWQQQDGQPQDELRRSTLKCVPVLSNLPAIAVNRRFIDKDLNRQFKRETLDTILRNTSAASVSGADAATVEMEDYSATRLNALLGPKTEFYTEPTQVDFIVDMHSSTSNLGNMLILGCLTHDNLAAHTAFTVKQRLNAAEGGASLSNGTLRVASTDVTKEVSHWVDR